MGERRRGRTPGGCIGGLLGGLVGPILGGWIAFIFLEPQLVPLEEPISAAKFYLFITVNTVLLSVVVGGGLAGGVVGILVGSMLGAVAFPQLHVTPDVTAKNSDGERPQGELRWVNGAIYGLTSLGLFGVAISTLMLGDNKAEGIGFMLWALMGVASGIMLSKRARTGKILGVVFVLPGLIVFPLGTVIALLLLYALFCDQTSRYLAGSSE